MILIFGGLTGGLGQPLHKALCAMYADNHVVMALGRKHCDVESEESIQRFFASGFVIQGPLHIINATGVSVSAMIHKTELGDVGRMLRVNLISNILMLKHARELYKAHGGTFTMVGSISASDGSVGTGAYAASKAALSGLAKVASKEFARFEVRVNVIELGYTLMGMISQVPDFMKLREHIPLARFGHPTDVAEACRFLIECTWITGATIKLNGGMA